MATPAIAVEGARSRPPGISVDTLRSTQAVRNMHRCTALSSKHAYAAAPAAFRPAPQRALVARRPVLAVAEGERASRGPPAKNPAARHQRLPRQAPPRAATATPRSRSAPCGADRAPAPGRGLAVAAAASCNPSFTPVQPLLALLALPCCSRHCAHRGAGAQHRGHARHQVVLRGQGRQRDQALRRREGGALG